MCGGRKRMDRRRREMRVAQVGMTEIATIETCDPGTRATMGMTGEARREIRMTCTEVRRGMRSEARSRATGEVRNTAAARVTAAKMRRTEMGSATTANVRGEMRAATTATTEMRAATTAAEMRSATTPRMSTASWRSAARMSATWMTAAGWGGENRAGAGCQHQTNDAGACRDLERG